MDERPVPGAGQESGLRVLTQGDSDRDSAGIFQQRPSQGWGSVEQVMDPVYASQQFFEHLQQVPNWETMALTVAAQTVQRSAYPDAYAKWKTTAHALASALTGQPGGAQVTCRTEVQAVPASSPSGEWPPEKMGADGPIRGPATYATSSKVASVRRTWAAGAPAAAPAGTSLAPTTTPATPST